MSRKGIHGFPCDVPAVAAVESLRLDAPVTLLAGDNGSGKSTLVEAIAEAMGFAAEGGELERLGELPAVARSVVGGALKPVLSATKPRTGYFLRAESFFNIARLIDSGEWFAPDLSLYGDMPLHQQSHRESFLALAANRFGGEGLYIRDEPEAALSVSGTLALRGGGGGGKGIGQGERGEQNAPPDAEPGRARQVRLTACARHSALTPSPKAGAECVRRARRDLRGGPPAGALPTATSLSWTLARSRCS